MNILKKIAMVPVNYAKFTANYFAHPLSTAPNVRRLSNPKGMTNRQITGLGGISIVALALAGPISNVINDVVFDSMGPTDEEFAVALADEDNTELWEEIERKSAAAFGVNILASIGLAIAISWGTTTLAKKLF